MAYKYSKNNKHSGKQYKSVSQKNTPTKNPANNLRNNSQFSNLPADHPTKVTPSQTYDLSSARLLNTDDVMVQEINYVPTSDEPVGSTAVLQSLIHQPNDTLIIEDLPFKTIDKTFGRKDDYIELHIYNTNNQLIHSDLDFKDYTIPENQDCYPLSKHLQIDPKQVLA